MFFQTNTIKKGQKKPSHDVQAKHHFFMPNQTTLKKAKFVEFGLKNGNLATLLPTRDRVD